MDDEGQRGDNKNGEEWYSPWLIDAENKLGIKFIDWKAFMLFCFLKEEGKEYFKTLPAEVQGRMICSSAMIDQARSY